MVKNVKKCARDECTPVLCDVINGQTTMKVTKITMKLNLVSIRDNHRIIP